MFLENLYECCGILATFVGTLLEGEVFLLTAIISAKVGLFSYKAGLAAAFSGAYVQAWFKFLIAKRHGIQLLKKKPKLKEKIDKASKWFDKSPVGYLVGFKFIFGMTTIILVLLGLKDFGYLKFGIFSAIAIALWVVVLGGFGYFFAEPMLQFLNAVSMNKWLIIGVLCIIGLIVYFYKRGQDNHCLKLED